MHIKKIEHNSDYSKITITLSNKYKYKASLRNRGSNSFIWFVHDTNDILFEILGVNKFALCRKLKINYREGQWPETTPENAIRLLNALYKPNMYDEF